MQEIGEYSWFVILSEAKNLAREREIELAMEEILHPDKSGIQNDNKSWR